MPRYFLLKEANDLLPIVRPLVREMMEISERIRQHSPALWAAVEKAAGNGGNPALSKLLPDFDRLDFLLRQVRDLGVEVKDLTTGLVDFPALHEERVIYLCWKYGEARIEFWHELDAGFAGRKRIDWQ